MCLQEEPLSLMHDTTVQGQERAEEVFQVSARVKGDGFVIKFELARLHIPGKE